MVVVFIRLLTTTVNKGSLNKQLHMIHKLNIFVILHLLYIVVALDIYLQVPCNLNYLTTRKLYVIGLYVIIT